MSTQGSVAAFEKVNAWREEHPGSTIAEASKACGVSVSYYYSGKKIIERNGKKSAPPRSMVIEAAPPALHTSSGKIAVFVGSPEVVARMFGL